MMMAMAVSLLERELYSVAEAAQLLTTPNRRVHPQTLRRWLEGDVRKGTVYPPVIRPEPTGSDAVTWAEFVEADLLAEYRHKSVPLQRLRPLIDGLRRAFGVPYPLAHFKPAIDRHSREVVLELQEEHGIPRSLWLVLQPRQRDVVGYQGVMLSAEVERHLDRIDMDADAVATRMRPYGATSAVIIDPALSFGIPTIEGIRTETIAELFWAGEPLATIADDFQLTAPQIEEAIRWESRSSAA